MRREFDYLYYTYVLHVDNDGFTSNIITAAVYCRRLRYVQGVAIFDKRCSFHAMIDITILLL